MLQLNLSILLLIVIGAVNCSMDESTFAFQIINEYRKMIQSEASNLPNEDDCIWDTSHHKREENERFQKLKDLLSSYHFRIVNESVPLERAWSSRLLFNVSKSRTNILTADCRLHLWHATSQVLIKRQFELIMGRSDAQWRHLQQALEKASYNEMSKRLDLLVSASNETLNHQTFPKEIQIMLKTLPSKDEVYYPQLSSNPLRALYLRKAINIYFVSYLRLAAHSENVRLSFAKPLGPADVQILEHFILDCGGESVEEIIRRKVNKISKLRERLRGPILSSEVSSYVAAYFQLLCWAMQEDPVLYNVQNVFELEERTRGKLQYQKSKIVIEFYIPFCSLSANPGSYLPLFYSSLEY